MGRSRQGRLQDKLGENRMWMRVSGSKINEMEGKKKRGGVEGESGGAESSRCWKDGKQASKRRAGDTPQSREPRTPPACCDLRLFRTNAGGSSGRKLALAKLRACAPCARELPGVGQRERAAPDKEGVPQSLQQNRIYRAPSSCRLTCLGIPRLAPL